MLSSGCGVCGTPSSDALSSDDGIVSAFGSAACCDVDCCVFGWDCAWSSVLGL